jgi:hypothetical protein
MNARNSRAAAQAAALALAATIALAGCGEPKSAITKGQWQAVDLGSTKRQVIRQLGKDPFQQRRSSGDTCLNYDPGKGKLASFCFDRGTRRLDLKTWIEEGDGNEINRAEYRGVRKGARESSVISDLGDPHLTSDIRSRLRAFGKQFKVAKRCLYYDWPGTEADAQLCFRKGKLADKTAPQ